jgi:L-ascorbate metabolism protein UlaG (beta-lactamase superfamily)
MIACLRVGSTIFTAIAATVIVILGVDPVAAQQRNPSTCLAIAGRDTAPKIWNASSQVKFGPQLVQAENDKVNIRYATHSTYRITSPGGLVIATDFAGRAGTGRLPDVVTMNHAHTTHYTMSPDPGIQNVLKGWPTDGIPANYHMELADVLIRNVTSDIYRSGILIQENGNSIFIFEIAGLCIGHVGHLHHTLTSEHFAAIGRLDILMVPVDGSVTMSVEGMSELARQFRSSIILPMHWFSGFSLQRFLQNMSENFAIDIRNESDMDASLFSLPSTPTVVVLEPELGQGYGFGFDP